MLQFRWPELLNDVALAREVASTRPAKNADWEKIAGTLSAQFSTEEKVICHSSFALSHWCAESQVCMYVVYFFP